MTTVPSLDADTFAGHLVLLGLADSTVRSYRCLYTRWCDYALEVGRDPHRPDPLTVRAWASRISGSRALVAQARAMIGHLCRLLDTVDCSTAIPLPRQSRRPRTRALSDLQARRLAQVADTAGAPGLAVLVGLYTGARRSEIAGLAWDDVDLDAREITFTRPKVRDRLTVPLHSHLHRRLEVRWAPGERWVFPGRHGGHVAAAVIWGWVREVGNRAGVGHVTPHMLRHTFIGEVYDRSRDLRAAQDLAGHEDPSITARYSSRSRDQLTDAVESVDWLGEGA